MEAVKMIPAIGRDELRSLAGVIARRSLKATPEECVQVFASEAGQRVLELIEAERNKKAARALGGQRRSV